MYQTPHGAGDRLWHEVAEEAARRKALEAAAAEAAAAAAAAATEAAEAASLPPSAPKSPRGGAKPPSRPVSGKGAAAPAGDAAAAALAAAEATAAAAAAAGEVGDIEPAPGGGVPAEGPPPPTVVVVTGPHLSGVTTQAQLLGGRYGVPVTTFDDLLLEAADAEAVEWTPEQAALVDAAAAARAAAAAAEEEAANAAAGAVGGKGGKPGPTAKPGAKGAPPVAEPVPLPDYDPGVPYFDREIADLLFEKVLADPDHEHQPGFVPPHSMLSQPELHALILRALRQALVAAPLQAKWARGFVLDSLRSKYVDPPTAARLLMQALHMREVGPRRASGFRVLGFKAKTLNSARWGRGLLVLGLVPLEWRPGREGGRGSKFGDPPTEARLLMQALRMRELGGVYHGRLQAGRDGGEGPAACTRAGGLLSGPPGCEQVCGPPARRRSRAQRAPVACLHSPPHQLPAAMGSATPPYHPTLSSLHPGYTCGHACVQVLPPAPPEDPKTKKGFRGFRV